MLYEYQFDEDESFKKDVRNVLLKSKKLQRNHFYYTVLLNLCIVVLLLIIVAVVAFVNSSDIIYLKLFGIGSAVFMIATIYNWVIHRENRTKLIERAIERHWKDKRTIKIKEYGWDFTHGKIKNSFRGKEVIEIIKCENYTLIFSVHRFLKYVVIVEPVIIPNDLFGSEEKYNEYINIIS